MLEHMALRLPFSGVDRRTVWLRATLLSACFFGLLASLPLWLNAHTFPLLPIVPGFPILGSPWDKCLFGSMLLALLLAAWFYRAAITFFLLAVLFAFCEDQNRGQPWLYMYWVMLWLTLLPAPASIAACRLALSVTYIWSGIQKFNARFFQVAPAWFVSPAAHWHLPPAAIELLRWGVASAPFVELGIGLALWSPRLRPGAIGAGAGLHLAALLFLGPLGHNYNWVVWPWNLAMIALLFALFATGRLWQKNPAEGSSSTWGKVRRGGAASKQPVATSLGPRLAQTFAGLRRSKPAVAALALYSLLPILSYFGWWDSYFSFSLYAENSANANIFVTQAFGDRLPPKLRAYVQQFPQAYDPQHQGPCVFVFFAWCYEELHVPPISEPRNFRSIFNALRAYSREPNDLRMIVGQRAGPVIFYQGDTREFLTPKP